MALAQQCSEDRFHIYMYADPDPTHDPKKVDRLTHVHEPEKYPWNTVLMNSSASDPSFQRTAFGSPELGR
jgi:hypothetical protein